MMNLPIQLAIPSTGEEELQAIRGPLMSGWLTQGPRVKEFEDKFAAQHNVKFGIATTSCTTALHLILHAMKIGPGDEVIVPSFTWIASANAVRYCGATPVFADISLNTFNLDIDNIQEKINSKTKAVIAVHLFGLCVDIAQLRKKLPASVKIIEDAACASGSFIGRYMAGSMGDAAAFSFHPRKIITTGEGGMVTTNDAKLAERIVTLRNHGAESPTQQSELGHQPYLMPEFNELGFNYRMTDLQAAVGIEQLAKLKNFILERQIGASYYQEILESIDWLTLPLVATGHSLQSYVVTVDAEKAPIPRNDIMDNLSAQGISTRPGTHAIHLLRAYWVANEENNMCPNATYCAQQTMAIPMHNKMTKEDYQFVAKAIVNIGR